MLPRKLAGQAWRHKGCQWDLTTWTVWSNAVRSCSGLSLSSSGYSWNTFSRGRRSACHGPFLCPALSCFFMDVWMKFWICYEEAALLLSVVEMQEGARDRVIGGILNFLVEQYWQFPWKISSQPLFYEFFFWRRVCLLYCACASFQWSVLDEEDLTAVRVFQEGGRSSCSSFALLMMANWHRGAVYEDGPNEQAQLPT